MKKKDLKVGDTVVIKRGKYDSFLLGVIVDLDPDALARARREVNPGKYYSTWRSSGTKGKVLVSYLQGVYRIEKAAEALSPEANWTSPTLVTLASIRNLFTPEFVQAKLDQSERWKNEWESTVRQRRADRDQLKKTVDRANQALGGLYFDLNAYGLEDYRTYSPGSIVPRAAKVILYGSKSLEAVVSKLAQIDQNIESMLSEVGDHG